MAATNEHRIPVQGWLLPLVALAAGLLLGKNGDWIAGAALAVLLIGSVMVAVHHAELVALWLREPYGTLVLTLAVTIIELSLIVSLMLTGKSDPGLARDAVHAVVMLVLNGLAGICIVAGTLRHREQEFQTLGANAFLAVLMPMAVLVLVMPNYTLTTPGPLLLDVATDLCRKRLPFALPGVPVRADRASPELLRAVERDGGRASCRAAGTDRCDQRGIAGVVARRGHLAGASCSRRSSSGESWRSVLPSSSRVFWLRRSCLCRSFSPH